MKRVGVILVLLILGILAGCQKREQVVWETVSDTMDLPVAALEPRFDVTVFLPEDVEAQEAFSEGSVQVFEGEDLFAAVETLRADSLDQLLLDLTGKAQKDLAIIRSEFQGLPRYDLTWIACGEAGMEAWRCAILDDGMHYYVVTAAAPAEKAEELRQQLEYCFSNIRLQASSGIPA